MQDMQKGREIAKLIDLVEERFEALRYPGDHVILHPEFVKEDWNTISDEKLERNFDELPILSDEGFHYFLPAYLLHSLKHFNDRSRVLEFTVYALSPGKQAADMAEWHKRRFGLFTAEQMDVIYKFLELVLADEGLYNYHKVVERGLPRLKKYRSFNP